MLGLVVALLLLGVLLLILEIVFVPGTTIVGIGGVILLAIGVFLAYDYISTTAGHISLAASLALVMLSLIIVLKGNTWKRVALDDRLEGRSSDTWENLIQVGAKGKTISRLNPIGKAAFEDSIFEVTASGEFVDEGVDVEVVKVEQNRIKVKTV